MADELNAQKAFLTWAESATVLGEHEKPGRHSESIAPPAYEAMENKYLFDRLVKNQYCLPRFFMLSKFCCK